MAAISLSPRVKQRRPTSSGRCQSRRKCTFSIVKSVVTSNSCPGGMRSTAQSSPMPVTTDSPTAGRAADLLNQFLFAKWHDDYYTPASHAPECPL